MDFIVMMSKQQTAREIQQEEQHQLLLPAKVTKVMLILAMSVKTMKKVKKISKN
jgi:hypothetical protein